MTLSSAQPRGLSQAANFASDLMAFTGHELRNHLTILRMASMRMRYAIDNNLAPEAQHDAVNRIQHSTLLLQQSALHYLTLAEMNQPNFEPKVVLIDPVKDIIEPLLFLYADLLATNNQQCRVEVGYPGILIWADRQLLSSVFENLLSNAIKYGGPDGIILIRIDERGNENEISVFNSGTGISSEQLDRLFEPFTRGKGPDDVSGHGIGLYLVRKIVEAHHGYCWVESQFGQWTRFTFTLPRRGH